MTPIDRFFAKVSFEPMSGCWLWTGAKSHLGYGHLRADKRYWTAHRYSWALVHGGVPEGMELDHVCHCPSCVNPDHLRVATHAENMRNSLIQKNNKCGFKGVTWRSDRKRWRAVITADGVFKHLGYFDSAEEAHAAYCCAAKTLHGAFANFGEKP